MATKWEETILKKSNSLASHFFDILGAIKPSSNIISACIGLLLMVAMVPTMWAQPTDQDANDATLRNYRPVDELVLPKPLGGFQAIQALIVYPPDAREQQIQGTVMVVCTIDVDGSPQNVDVGLGPPILYQAAIDAVRLSQWEPARIHRQPVPLDIHFDLHFSLENGPQAIPPHRNVTWRTWMGAIFFGLVIWVGHGLQAM